MGTGAVDAWVVAEAEPRVGVEGAGDEGGAGAALVNAGLTCLAGELTEGGGSSSSSSFAGGDTRRASSSSPSSRVGRADDGGKVCAASSPAWGVGGVERHPGRDSRFNTDDAAADDDELDPEREGEEEDAIPPAAVGVAASTRVNSPLPNEMTTSSRGPEGEEEDASVGAGGRTVGEGSACAEGVGLSEGEVVS